MEKEYKINIMKSITSDSFDSIANELYQEENENQNNQNISQPTNENQTDNNRIVDVNENNNISVKSNADLVDELFSIEMGKNINLSKKNSLKKMIDENKVEEGREKSTSPRKKSLDFFTEKNETTDDGNNFSKKVEEKSEKINFSLGEDSHSGIEWRARTPVLTTTNQYDNNDQNLNKNERMRSPDFSKIENRNSNEKNKNLNKNNNFYGNQIGKNQTSPITVSLGIKGMTTEITQKNILNPFNIIKEKNENQKILPQDNRYGKKPGIKYLPPGGVRKINNKNIGLIPHSSVAINFQNSEEDGMNNNLRMLSTFSPLNTSLIRNLISNDKIDDKEKVHSKEYSKEKEHSSGGLVSGGSSTAFLGSINDESTTLNPKKKI